MEQPTALNVHCTGCGRKRDGSETFCPSCGKKLDPIPPTATLPDAPARRSRRGIGTVAVVAGIAVVAIAALVTLPKLGTLVAATPVPSATPAQYVLTGTFKLYDDDLGGVNSCWGKGGYDDIRGGLDVVVRDASHTILATSNLDEGAHTGNGVCTFIFAVKGVPKATFYSIEVGHRGELTYSFDEIVALGWQVGFTLGA